MTPCGDRLTHLGYADDTGQLSGDVRAATGRLTRLEQHSKLEDLDISGVKTKGTMFKRDVNVSAIRCG